MEVSFALRLPTEAAAVPFIRALCRTNLGELQVTKDCIEDVGLAVTEACANVVKHSGVDSGFDVRVHIVDETCRIVVRDEGSGFDEGAVKRSFADAESGRGIELMRELVDDLHYQPDGTGTSLTLIKQLEFLPDSPLQSLRAPR